MPEVDSSIYGKLNTGAPNALQNMSPSDMIGFAQRALDYQTRQGVSNAFRDSVDPGGNYDPQKMLQNLRKAPGAPTPEHAQAAVELGQRALDFRLKQTAATQDFLGTLANDPSMTADKAMGYALRHSANTGIPPAVYLNFLRGAPNSPTAFHDYITNINNAALGAAGASERVSGPPTASGQTTTLAKGQAGFATQGIPNQAVPGTAESAQLFQADQARAGSYPSNIQPWQSALDKLQQLGPQGSGPGTADRNKLLSYIQTGAPELAKRIGINEQHLNAFDEARKYLTQATLGQGLVGGADTNEKLAKTFQGSPNMDIQHGAAVDVVKMAIAYRRLEHLQAMEASQAGPAQYSMAKAANATRYDPRALGIDMMTPDQIRTLDKSLKGADREKFNRTLSLARKQYGLF